MSSLEPNTQASKKCYQQRLILTQTMSKLFCGIEVQHIDVNNLGSAWFQYTCVLSIKVEPS